MRALATDGRAAREGAGAGVAGWVVVSAAGAGGVLLYMRGVLLFGARRVFFLAMIKLLLD